MKKSPVRAVCYAGAVVIPALAAIPGFRLWQRVQSGRWGYDDEAYFDYDRVRTVGTLLLGILVAALLIWVSRRFAKP